MCNNNVFDCLLRAHSVHVHLKHLPPPSLLALFCTFWQPFGLLWLHLAPLGTILGRLGGLGRIPGGLEFSPEVFQGGWNGRLYLSGPNVAQNDPKMEQNGAQMRANRCQMEPKWSKMVALGGHGAKMVPQ